MLLNFEFENFRSFKDKTTLSMKASSQTTFNDTLIRTNGLRTLLSAVIYGANASGKSNVIKSLFSIFTLSKKSGKIQRKEAVKKDEKKLSE